ncbi:IS110 family transposase (plasmid) [Bradyrhizobium barranii]|uniref:IS110 family transposase n=1 Tax=Bradyrhizobium barranii TaxID=2992140 RepID=A0ABY3R0Z6_9BRAD|nr:IS110 family transposase [Bradyrhizobium japonicum]UFW91950.1 IS110 family transposase [Bradyrhizobium japonicum]
MTRTALEGFGKRLQPIDEVVIEATGNCMAVSRVLSPFVKRVVIANPLQVKAIAHAHVKTDKVDAGTLASLYAAGYLPEIWTPDAATERLRRLIARRYQVVRHRTRIKNEVHAILHAHLIPKCPHADLFNGRGRDWLAHQPVPDDERDAIERHVRELDRLAEDLTILDREIATNSLDDGSVRRLLTITGVNLAVAAGLMAAIGDITRFKSPQKLVSYFGLNPRVHQSGLGAAHHGRISKVGRSHARAMLVEAAWAAAKTPGPLHAFFVRIRARRGHQVAAVAVARKLTVLCWHLLTNEEDYLWARPSLVAHKMRGMELQAGRAQKKATRAALPTPTISNNSAIRRCTSPSKRREGMSTLSKLGARARQKKRRAGASTRQDTDRAARRRLQPTRRSSPRGHPRTTITIAVRASSHPPGTRGR